MTRQEDLPAGWLTQFRRGVLSGAGLLLLAVAGCALPTFAVWLVPGGDSSPASSAVKSGALLALAAAHGGVQLNGVPVTLVPLLVTVLLGWLVAGQARRAESWPTVVGLAVGYGLGSGLLAGWASIGATRAPSLPSALAGSLFVGTVAALARGGRAGWGRLTERHRRIGRAAGSVSCCYLGAAALLVAGSLLAHLPPALATQRQLAPGVAGLPVALLDVGLAPNAVLAGVGYLSGPGFQVGSHTRVSVLATSHGRLPSLPLLAAVPTDGPATAVGLLAIAAVALLAGWLCVRLLRSTAGWSGRLADVAASAALAGGSLAALTALGAGGIGSGALSAIGARWWAVGGCAGLLVLLSSAAWLAVDLVRAGSTAVAAEPAPARLRAVAGLPANRPAAQRAAEQERPAAGESNRPAAGERPGRSRNAG
ncbi:MAG: DUF6350 family protein [Jatrophihabitantaceae bacterium]